jgi:hypothetical protein
MSEREPIMNYESLLKAVKSPKDQFLVALIAAFVDSNTAQKTVDILRHKPAPLDYSRIMFGVKISEVIGLTDERIKEGWSLGDLEIEEIRKYVNGEVDFANGRLN